MRAAIACLVALAAGIVPAGMVLFAQSPGDATRGTFIEPAPPVASLRALWDETPVVLVGTSVAFTAPDVETSFDEINGRARASYSVSRLQTFRVDDVLKDDHRLLRGAATVNVRVPGGEVVRAGVRYFTNTPHEPFDDGQIGVLFLLPRTNGSGEFSFASWSVGALRQSRADPHIVEIDDRTSRLPEFRGRHAITFDDFLALLHGFAEDRSGGAMIPAR
jgi:hypothetical protein